MTRAKNKDEKVAKEGSPVAAEERGVGDIREHIVPEHIVPEPLHQQFKIAPQPTPRQVAEFDLRQRNNRPKGSTGDIT